MAERPSEPTNKSLLSPIGFSFNIQKLPHVNYFCTQATIPDVTLGVVELHNPFVKTPKAGDKLEFADLSLQFKVDEDMKNYQEIFNWMQGLGYPDNFDQRANLIAGSHIYSDASLLITTNQYKPNIDITFIDLHPTSLSAVEFNIEQGDVDYLNADVSFAYRRYKLTTVS